MKAKTLVQGCGFSFAGQSAQFGPAIGELHLRDRVVLM